MERVVFFDFGNVCCTFDNGLFLQDLAQLLPGRSIEQIRSLVYPETKGAEASLCRQYESGSLSTAQFANLLLERLGLVGVLSPQALMQRYTPPNKFQRIAGVEEVMRDLKARCGVSSIVLLSNTSEQDLEAGFFRSFDMSLFDGLTVSFRVGAMKANRAIFDAALAEARAVEGDPQLQPSECVYIDDIQEYVESGQAYGFRAIHLEAPNGDLLRTKLRAVFPQL